MEQKKPGNCTCKNHSTVNRCVMACKHDSSKTKGKKNLRKKQFILSINPSAKIPNSSQVEGFFECKGNQAIKINCITSRTFE